MNKLKFVTSLFFLFSITFLSCTVEPYGGSQAALTNAPVTPPTTPPVVVVPVASVVGNYRLTAHNTSVPTDLNGNGTASVNQMLETSCFNNSSATINANGTFSAVDNFPDLTSVAGVSGIVCDTDNYNGTWTLVGNTITFTYNTAGTTIVDIATFANNAFTFVDTNSDFINVVNNQFVFVTGNIQNIFTKQ